MKKIMIIFADLQKFKFVIMQIKFRLFSDIILVSESQYYLTLKLILY